MKTAMQELIERLKQLSEDRNADNIGIKNFMEKQSDIIDEQLEKEKEQIIDAYCRLVIDDLGYILNDKYEYAENKRIAEQYYNETYSK
jgi:uncharacterized protein (UPF0305 family)